MWGRRAGRPAKVSSYSRGAWVLAAGLALVSCSAEPTWTEFQADSGDFTVEMPGTPDREILSAPIPGGEVDLSLATVDLGDSAFLTSDSLMPEGVPISLQGAVDGSVSNMMAGTITSREELVIQDIPCIRFSATGQSDGHDIETEGLACNADRHLYQFLVVNGSGEPERTDRFFDSLRFAG